MSGHSKWSTIKRQKGVADQKRGQIFTKLAQNITIAVVSGGGIADPESNFRLRLAIEKAHEANMPKENIQRAILRASDSVSNNNLQEVTYEGYGLGGVAILIEATTDNRARTFSEIKNIFEKNGGNLASKGAVSYLFEQKGLMTVPIENKKSEEIELLLIDAGVEDIEEAGKDILAYIKPQDLMSVKKKIEEQGLTVLHAELTMEPKDTIKILDLETARKILTFIDILENSDDIQKVHANFEIPDSILSQIQELK